MYDKLIREMLPDAKVMQRVQVLESLSNGLLDGEQ